MIFTAIRPVFGFSNGRDVSLFDPTALSPVVITADLDGSFSGWLPLRADPEVDCFAPVVVK